MSLSRQRKVPEDMEVGATGLREVVCSLRSIWRAAVPSSPRLSPPSNGGAGAAATSLVGGLGAAILLAVAPASWAESPHLAADKPSAGDFYAIETEASRTRAAVPNTGGYDQFVEQPGGRLTLRAGVNRIVLRPDGKLRKELADVRGLRLISVRGETGIQRPLP